MEATLHNDMVNNRRTSQTPPSQRDFSAGAVRRAVFSDAVQHPLTLFPAAAALLGGAYLALIDVARLPFQIMLGGAVLAVGSWVYRYFIKGDELARRHVDKLKRRYLAAKQRGFDDIVRACGNHGFHEGAKEARELQAAYQKLVGFLDQQDPTRADAQRFAVLAAECYQEGLAILKKAVAVYAVLRNMRENELKVELRNWQQQAKLLQARLASEPNLRDRLDALNKRMASHRQRLDLCDERRGAVEQLLAESEELEAAMEAAYVEVADLFESGGFALKTDPAGNLERAVAAARRVENRLSAMEGETVDEDQRYREAGSRENE